MKTIGFLLLAISFLLMPESRGDKLRLKDGTVLEGTVISDTPEEVIFSVEIRPGIKVNKKFAGADVALVTISTPDDKAFQIIEAYAPTPDRLPVGDYANRIKRVEAFLNAYKESPHRRKADVILKTLQEELGKVQAGGLKLDDKWLTKEEYGSDAYEIDAQIIARDMAKAVKNGSSLSALRKFEVLKKDYSGSKAYPRVIEALPAILSTYEATIKPQLSEVKSLIATREKEFATLNSVQKRQAEDDVKRANDRYARLMEFQKKTKEKWLSIDAYHAGPMEDTLTTIEREQKNLEGFDAGKLVPIGEKYRTAWEAATARNRTRVEELAPDLISGKLPKKYAALISERLSEAEAQAEEDGPDAPEEPETPEEADPEGDKPTTTDPDTAKDSERDDDEPVEKRRTRDSSASSDDDESGGILRPILFAVIGIVIAIALITVFTGKKKNS